MTKDDARSQTLELLSKGDQTAQDIAKETGRSERYIRAVIKDLEDEGIVHSCGLRNKYRLFRLGTDPIPHGMKKCSKCGEVKPADTDHFPRHKGGLHGWCLDCKRYYHREHIRRLRIGDEKRRANAEDKRQEDASRMYDVKEVEPGYRQYRLAGGYKSPRVEKKIEHMAGYASGLTWII